jgi:hypothetical protein
MGLGNGACLTHTPNALSPSTSDSLLGNKFPDGMPLPATTTSQTIPINRFQDGMGRQPAPLGTERHPNCSAHALLSNSRYQESASVTHDGAAESTGKRSGTSHKEPHKRGCGMTPPRIDSETKLGTEPRKRQGVHAGMLRELTVPKRTSSLRPGLHSKPGSLGSGKRYQKSHAGRARRRFSDHDVLNGLKIAVSVACDEVIDELVQRKTGLQIRRFLADLMVLEIDSEGTMEYANLDKVRRMRAEMKKLKLNVRRTRELQKLALPEALPA